jgi:hypothetical protein
LEFARPNDVQSGGELGIWALGLFTTIATVVHNRKPHIEILNSGQVKSTLECPLEFARPNDVQSGGGLGIWALGLFTTVATIEHNSKSHIETLNSRQAKSTLEGPLEFARPNDVQSGGGLGIWALGLFTTVATIEHNRKSHIETLNSGQVKASLVGVLNLEF